MKTESNQLDFSILDIIQEPVLVVGKDLKVIFINDSLSTMAGKSLKQAKGNTVASIIKAEHSGISEVFSSGERISFQTWATIKGTKKYLELTGNPVIDNEGEVSCVVEVIKDLSGQKSVCDAVEELIEKAKSGDLNARATVKAEGDFQTLVDGVNEMLDAVINPINEVMDVLRRAAVNDFELMGQDYSGAWDDLKGAINTVVGRLLTVTDIVSHVSQGNLSDVDNLKAIGRRSEKDNLIPALIHMLEEIQKLADDTHGLTRAALEGKLSARADVSQHSGEFNKIVAGINETLDAILVPINEAVECLKEMATGNLDVAMIGSYQGDHAMIKDALNHTLDSINEILNEVSKSTQSLATGSQQVSNSSQSLAQGATESAAALEQISSSMHELTAQTKQNAENAGQANQLADQARTDAIKGREQMNLLGMAMKEISDSAADISKIIKAIDEIAFQTNLLALNAAVEAARAGQHGKGFAVVAEEVRNLAARSANAAKETAEMIEGSIKKTEVGARIAEETSRALEEIVTGSARVTDLVGEMASASKEQAQGIGQINQGLGQVDQVTQQVTANAEESASASEELSGQAIQLKQMLSKFKLRQPVVNMSIPGLPAGITPEILQMIQNLIQTQGIQVEAKPAAMQVAWGNSAVSDQAPRLQPKDIIALDDTEFGNF